MNNRRISAVLAFFISFILLVTFPVGVLGETTNVPEHWNFTGHVYVAGSDEPIGGAKVLVFNEYTEQSILTPDDGSFGFLLRQGVYGVEVIARGFFEVEQRIEIIAEHVTVQDFSLQPMEREGNRIEGWVFIKGGSDPVPGALVHIQWLEKEDNQEFQETRTETDQRGHFILDDLPEGFYGLSVEKEGFQEVFQEVELFDDQVAHIEIALVPIGGHEASFIEGVVLNGELGKPVWAEVQLERLGEEPLLYHTKTDDDGWFGIRVAPGEYLIHVLSPEFHPYEDSFEIGEGEMSLGKILLKPLDMKVPLLSGTVFDAGSNCPIPAQVHLRLEEQRPQMRSVNLELMWGFFDSKDEPPDVNSRSEGSDGDGDGLPDDLEQDVKENHRLDDNDPQRETDMLRTQWMGHISVSEGRIELRDLLKFEEEEDFIHEQTSPTTIMWTSIIYDAADGLVAEVFLPESPNEVYVSIFTPHYQNIIPAVELEMGFHDTIVVDDRGQKISIDAFALTPDSRPIDAPDQLEKEDDLRKEEQIRDDMDRENQKDTRCPPEKDEQRPCEPPCDKQKDPFNFPTDCKGHFELWDIPPGHYQIIVKAPCHMEYYNEIDIGGEPQHLEIYLRNTPIEEPQWRIVKGQVLDAQTEEPIRGAVLTFSPYARGVTTQGPKDIKVDDAGRPITDDSKPEDDLDPDGSRPSSTRCDGDGPKGQKEGNDKGDVPLSDAESSSKVLPGGGPKEMDGDSNKGKVDPNVEVNMKSVNLKETVVRTDERGYFEMRLPAGVYIIVIKARGYEPAKQRLKVSEDVDVNKVSIVMEPADQTNERVRDSEGEEVASLGDQSSEGDGGSNIPKIALGAMTMISILIIIAALLFGKVKKGERRKISSHKRVLATPGHTSKVLK